MTTKERNPEIHIANQYLPIPEDGIRNFCLKWNVLDFRFYGSIMRDDFRQDSDVDVMVEYDPGTRPTFSDLCTMQDELETLFGRKVDLADRRSVEKSPNYIRRKGMLSGKPPTLRQMSYLLDMLIWAPGIETVTRDHHPDAIEDDEVLFHALSFQVFRYVVSAGRIDKPCGNLYREFPGICWMKQTTSLKMTHSTGVTR